MIQVMKHELTSSAIYRHMIILRICASAPTPHWYRREFQHCAGGQIQYGISIRIKGKMGAASLTSGLCLGRYEVSALSSGIGTLGVANAASRRREGRLRSPGGL